MTDEQFEKLNALAKTNPDDACAILVEEHIDELKAKDKKALWISRNIDKARMAKAYREYLADCRGSVICWCWKNRPFHPNSAMKSLKKLESELAVC